AASALRNAQRWRRRRPDEIPARRRQAGDGAVTSGRAQSGGAENVFAARYSTFAPDAFTTFSHLAVSSALILPNSSGVPLISMPPSSTILAWILGSASARLSSLLSLSMIARGVSFAVPTPNHALAS